MPNSGLFVWVNGVRCFILSALGDAVGTFSYSELESLEHQYYYYNCSAPFTFPLRI